MNLNLIHPEMNICSYGDCTTAFCVIVIGGDIYCKRHAIDALCGVELAALRARVGELEQERDAYKKIIDDVRAGNYDNAHDITAARKFIFGELGKMPRDAAALAKEAK